MPISRRLKSTLSCVLSFCLGFGSVFPSVAFARSARPSHQIVRYGSAKVHPKFTALEFGGRAYQYYEQTNGKGKVIRQFLLGKDRTEILTDSNGTGHLDSWEIFTKDGKLMFSVPYKGRFTFMDAETLTTKGIMRFKFVWNAKLRKYSLFAMKARPYKTIGYSEDFIVGCRGDADERKLEDLAKDLDANLERGNVESELARNLKDQTLTSKCKSPPFDKVADRLVSGMLKVAESDHKDWSKPDQAPDQKGQFLQCLRYYGLDVHASRIEAAFAQYTSAVPTNKYLWTVSCSAKTSGSDVASFTEADGSVPARVNIYADEDKAKKYLKDVMGISNPTPQDFEQAYARIFFHEMLHYSMMGESNAHTVENCCGQNVGADSKECTALKELTEKVKIKQGLDNILVQRLPNNYSDFRDAIRQAFGDQMDGDDAYNMFMMNEADMYNKYKNDPRCNSTPDHPLGSCKQEFIDKTKEYIHQLWGSQDGSVCREAVDKNLGKAEGQKTCGTLEAIFNSIADNGIGNGALQNFCPNIKKQDPNAGTQEVRADSLFWRPIAWILSPLVANATDANSVNSELCNVAGGMQSGPINWSTAPMSRDTEKLVPNAPSHDETTSHYGDSSGLSSSPDNQKTSYGPEIGPSRPNFSNDSSSRSNEILNHITHSESMISQFKDVAQKSFDVFVPKAQAESGNWSSTGSRSPASYRWAKMSPSNDPDAVEGYSVGKVPKMSVSNPLGSFGSDGAGGVAIPSSRTPAAAASAFAGAGAQASSKNSSDFRTASSSSIGSGGRGQGGSQIGQGGQSGLSGANRAGGSPVPGQSPAAGKAGENGLAHPRHYADPNEEIALQALLSFLQRDYEQVKPQLGRPSVEGKLLDHGVQVVDDEGHIYGAGSPEYKLVYDKKLKKLVPVNPRQPASKKR